MVVQFRGSLEEAGGYHQVSNAKTLNQSGWQFRSRLQTRDEYSRKLMQEELSVKRCRVFDVARKKSYGLYKRS